MSAFYDPETVDFKKILDGRQVEKRRNELSATTKLAMEAVTKLYRTTSALKCYSSVVFLKRILAQYESDVLTSHLRKLRLLFKGEVRKNFVKNPSQNCPTDS